MADEVAEVWESEEIPHTDLLYLRVHRNDIDPQGRPKPGAFRNRSTQQDGMSTDWCKYATPEASRQRARVPDDNGVVALSVEKVRQVPGQTVEHTPQQHPPEPLAPNRAHTDVWGPKNPEVRIKLLEIYSWSLRLGG